MILRIQTKCSDTNCNNPAFQSQKNSNFVFDNIPEIDKPVSTRYRGKPIRQTSINISLTTILTHTHNITFAWLQAHIIIYIHNHKFAFLYH
jgi:hypothetical protein